MTTLCIAHGTPTTGYPGEPREWAHCGWCAQELQRQAAADPMLPKNPVNGSVRGKSSKVRREHRAAFARRLIRHAEIAIIEGRTGMTVEQFAREYPYGYLALTREERLCDHMMNV